MKSKQLIFTLMLGLVFSPTFAQYAITKYSINNGGGKMTGGSYQLTGSIGQIDASNELSNNNYKLTGGFWQQNTDLIFINGFEQN